MKSHRIVGIVLLVVGVILLIVGLNASDSIADQMSETLTGKFTDSTTWYIIGGIAAALVGLLIVVFGGSRKSTWAPNSRGVSS